MGFVCGFLLLLNLAKRGLWVLKPEQTGGFIAGAAMLGVFLGGRVGYILWVVRTRCPKAPDGLLTGLFFTFYAAFRIFGEQFLEPVAAMVGPLTQAQFFSVFMFLFAVVFFFHAWREWRRNSVSPT